MTGLRPIIVKFTVFGLITLLIGWILVNTMVNGVKGDREHFTAQFKDVSGLRVGDDVRVAGVRVGQVDDIASTKDGADVKIEVQKSQPVLDTTKVVMRYQSLIGQRYLSMVQDTDTGKQLNDGATIPVERTSAGFDLTELLNGFRPLFQALKPEDVNKLATSLVKVLQGEGGTVETLLQQTGQLTNTVADKDKVIDDVLNNLTPVLNNLAGQGTELRSTVVELKALMQGLAKDRKAIGASISGMSQLISDSNALLRDAREPSIRAVNRFRRTMEEFMDSRRDFVGALRDFDLALGALGRGTSYDNSLNVYICTLTLSVAGAELNLNVKPGPYTEVCR